MDVNLLNSEWMLTFLKGDYLDDQEKKEQLFDYLYKYLKERVYLVLELEEGQEFSSTDIDENKLELQRRQDQITTQFAKTMYGPFSDFDSLTMDEWNMHTKAGEGVSRDKIKQVKTPDGKTDMLSIIIYEYDKHKDIPYSHLLLDDFIVCAKKRIETEEMLGKEGVKSDQDNINRIY